MASPLRPWPPRSAPAALCLAALAGLAAAGCGPSAADNTLTGTVKYNNNPVTGGRIIFRPQGAPANGSLDVSGTIKPDGTFSVGGVPAAVLSVGVTTETIMPQNNPYAKAPPGATPPPGTTQSAGTPMQIPAKYANPASSGITWDVKKDGTKKDITLTD